MTNEPIFRTVASKPLTGYPSGDAPFVPYSMVESSDGRFFVSDPFNHRILALGRDGNILNVFGRKGHQAGQYWYPMGLAIVPTDEGEALAVCDAWNHRVSLSDFSGNWLGEFGALGVEPGAFDEPRDIFVDGEGIGILDRGNHRVQRLSINGEVLSLQGGMTKGRKRPIDFFNRSVAFFFPMSFLLLPDGALIVADTGNRRLVVVGLDGTIQRTIFFASEADTSRSFPERLISLGAKRVLVIMVDGSAKVFDLACAWSELEVSKAMMDGGKPLFHDGKLMYGFDPSGESLLAFQSLDVELLHAAPDSSIDLGNSGQRNRVERLSHYVVRQALEGAESEERAQVEDYVLGQAKSLSDALTIFEGEIATLAGERAEHIERREEAKKNGKQADHLSLSQAVGKEGVQLSRMLEEWNEKWGELLSLIEQSGLTLAQGPQGSEIAERLTNFYQERMVFRRRGRHDAYEVLREQLAQPQSLGVAEATGAFSNLHFCLVEERVWEKLFGRMEWFVPSRVIERRTPTVTLLSAPNTNPVTIGDAILVHIVEQAQLWEFFDTALIAARMIVDRTAPENLLGAWLRLHLLATKGGFPDSEKLLVQMADTTGAWDERLELATRFQWMGDYAQSKRLLQGCSNEVPDGFSQALQRCQIMQGIGEREVSEPSVLTQESGVSCGTGQLSYVGSVITSHPETGEVVTPSITGRLNERGMLIGSTEGELFLVDREGATHLLLTDPDRMVSGIVSFGKGEVLVLLINYVAPFDSPRFVLVEESGSNCQDVSERFAFLLACYPLTLVDGDEEGLLAIGRDPVSGQTVGRLFNGSGEDGGEISPQPLIESAMISFAAMSNGRIYATDLRKNFFYSGLPLHGDEEGAVRELKTPLGVGRMPDASILVSTGYGSGVHVFGPNGDEERRITSLVSHERHYLLEQSHLSVNQISDHEAEVVLADRFGKRAHILRWVS